MEDKKAYVSNIKAKLKYLIEINKLKYQIERKKNQVIMWTLKPNLSTKLKQKIKY